MDTILPIKLHLFAVLMVVLTFSTFALPKTMLAILSVQTKAQKTYTPWSMFKTSVKTFVAIISNIHMTPMPTKILRYCRNL